jgi:hypothetical protein
MSTELLALVKHDCPVCVQLLPALDRAVAAGAPLRILSQSSAEDTATLARSLALSVVPSIDAGLEISSRFDPDAVPTVLLLADGAEQARVEGLDTAALDALAHRAGITLDLAGLPAHRPGCASLTRDPIVAPRLAARRARADGRIVSRAFAVGAHEDIQEALWERGVTDGLPVVPPTPERVVAMLEGTSRDPQDVVGVLPPYAGTATVEKVAVNAVMAGCTPPMLPVVIASVEAACDESFAMHGLLATTYPAGPLIVVSGPLTARIGMNSAGNCLGQGNRANLAIGRALQLCVRNIGGGRPGEEDRAAHGQMGKLAACFAERIDDSPFEPLSVDRGFAAIDTTVTLYAAEAPRVVLDQLSRDPDSLCRTYALVLQNVAHPKLCWAVDAVLVVGPEHGRIFAEYGWTRAMLRERVHALALRPAREMAQGADGIAEGMPAPFVADADAPLTKLISADRLAVVHAGGDAGLFSMLAGTWISGERGSTPVTRRVDPWT